MVDLKLLEKSEKAHFWVGKRPLLKVKVATKNPVIPMLCGFLPILPTFFLKYMIKKSIFIEKLRKKVGFWPQPIFTQNIHSRKIHALL